MLEASEIVSSTGYRKPNNNIFLFEDTQTGQSLVVNIEDCMVPYFKSRFEYIEDATIEEIMVHLDTMGLKKKEV